MREISQIRLEEFIARAGFPGGWVNLSFGLRRMAQQAVRELEDSEHRYRSAEHRYQEAMRHIGKEPPRTFEQALRDLINEHSQEMRGGNTPDFVLAAYLVDCLEAFNKATTARTRWHNSP